MEHRLYILRKLNEAEEKVQNYSIKIEKLKKN